MSFVERAAVEALGSTEEMTRVLIEDGLLVQLEATCDEAERLIADGGDPVAENDLLEFAGHVYETRPTEQWHQLLTESAAAVESRWRQIQPVLQGRVDKSRG